MDSQGATLETPQIQEEARLHQLLTQAQQFVPHFEAVLVGLKSKAAELNQQTQQFIDHSFTFIRDNKVFTYLKDAQFPDEVRTQARSLVETTRGNLVTRNAVKLARKKWEDFDAVVCVIEGTAGLPIVGEEFSNSESRAAFFYGALRLTRHIDQIPQPLIIPALVYLYSQLPDDYRKQVLPPKVTSKAAA